MTDTKICPKCHGLMERGSITPNSRYWINNPSFFTKLKKIDKLFNFMKPKFEEVKYYACTQCGYVEIYVSKDTKKT